MKRIILLLLLLSFVFVSADVTPEEVVGIAGDKLSDVSKNTDVYAEIFGENLLKFQELFMGTVGFVSLGNWTGAGELGFASFLLFVLLFMMLYSIVGLVFDKFNFGISFVITLLAFLSIRRETIEAIFLNYESMGIAITVVLPILILLSFTFRIYDKAYEGKGKTSPFYAEMFNLAFLVFFGMFFIQHSASEEGVISTMRYFSGWALIGLGISQTVFYEVFAKFLHVQRVEERKFKDSARKMKRDAMDAIRDVEFEALKKN